MKKTYKIIFIIFLVFIIKFMCAPEVEAYGEEKCKICNGGSNSAEITLKRLDKEYGKKDFGDAINNDIVAELVSFKEENTKTIGDVKCLESLDEKVWTNVNMDISDFTYIVDGDEVNYNTYIFLEICSNDVDDVTFKCLDKLECTGDFLPDCIAYTTEGVNMIKFEDMANVVFLPFIKVNGTGTIKCAIEISDALGWGKKCTHTYYFCINIKDKTLKYNLIDDTIKSAAKSLSENEGSVNIINISNEKNIYDALPVNHPEVGGTGNDRREQMYQITRNNVVNNMNSTTNATYGVRELALAGVGEDVAYWKNNENTTHFEDMTEQGRKNIETAYLYTTESNLEYSPLSKDKPFNIEDITVVEGVGKVRGGTYTVTDLMRVMDGTNEVGQAAVSYHFQYYELYDENGNKVNGEEYLVYIFNWEQISYPDFNLSYAHDSESIPAINKIFNLANEYKNTVVQYEFSTKIGSIITGTRTPVTNFKDVLTDIGIYKPKDKTAGYEDKIENKISIIVTVVTNIGMIVSVLMSAILGVKYMLGSVEEKAEYKKDMLPYFIGAGLLFGIIAMVKIMSAIGEQINNL